MALIFLFCMAFLPVFAEDDPEWLYQDGLITAGELAEQTLEPQIHNETAWNGRTTGRVSSQSDTNARFRKPSWNSTSRWNTFHGSVSGDSSLRLWQVYWKDAPWTCGGGFWKGADLSLAQPDSGRLGGWCDWSSKPLRAAFAGAKDSSGLLLLGWHSQKNGHMEIAYHKGPHENNLIMQGTKLDLRFSLLKPLSQPGAVISAKMNPSTEEETHILATATWNSTDTATKDLAAKVQWKQIINLWKFQVENRWNQFADTLTEWIAIASCQKDSDRSRISLSYSARSEPDRGPSQFLRLGAEWNFSKVPWGLFSTYQWRPLSQVHWEIKPQLESGVKYSENRKHLLRLSMVLPPEYRNKQISQIRFTAEAPISDAVSLKFRWAASFAKEQHQPIQRVKLFLAIFWQL